MIPPRDRKLLVFGNGPSLRGFDFTRTGSVDTLGMNAAYRYWDRIGWYPTHYCCVDDQLIETHHAEILRLITSGQVQSVFTLARILEFQPDLANMDNVYFREQFHGTLAAKLAPLGSDKPHIRHPAFMASNPRKLTTGAFAVRYGLFQGYTDIGLLGIDLEYVEVLPEAKAGEGLKLEIAEPVRHNPNYFFDDYQQPGDRYNIPNPAEHEGNLHVQAFEVLRDDLAIQGLDASVVNLNTRSRLHDLGILPYQRPAAFLGEAGIGAIAVPTTTFEVDDICRNLRLWDLPAYHPVLQRSAYGRTDLVFIFSQAPDPAARQQILETFQSTTYLKTMFRGGEPVFLSADLDDEADVYKRDYVTAPGEAGFKSGPNLQFFASMQALGARYPDFIFFMETDCAPVRAGWLTALDALARWDAESWVIGSPYLGQAQLDRRFARHLNGNALYRVGDDGFQAFLRSEWEPLLMEVIEAEDPRIAYDCVLARHWAQADSHARNLPWRHYQAHGRRFRASEAIVNLSGAEDLAGCEGVRVQDTLAAHPDAVIIHGRQYARTLQACIGEEWVSPGTLRLRAIARRGETPAPVFDPEVATAFILMPEGGARKLDERTFSLAGAGSESRLLVIFDARIEIEDAFTADLLVHASSPCQATISLSRHGIGEYEGAQTRVSLQAGENRLAMTHTFRRSHPRLRAQLSVADAQSVTLELRDVTLSRTLSWWPEGMDAGLEVEPIETVPA